MTFNSIGLLNLADNLIKQLKKILVLGSCLLLSSCDTGILNPKGIIAAAEQDLLVFATVLMLVIVIPTILLTLWVAWYYRASNKDAVYKPHWGHSVKVELVCWGAPLIIIVILAWITWVSTHELDPYKPIESKVKPVEIQVIALEWKWLFIYPEYNIATVNFVQFPIDTPINFKVTGDAAMNSFMIPQLGSQIYAMEGMQTKLHIMADKTGDYPGISANYSGYGFSGMKFTARASSNQDFKQWIKQVKKSKQKLTLARYNQLAEPTRDHSQEYFSKVKIHLFHKVIQKFMEPGDHGFTDQTKRRLIETQPKLHH